MVTLLKLPDTDNSVFSGYLKDGWKAFENANHEEALALLRKAAVADFRRPEPWYGMGLVQESLGDKKSAGYCFFMACDLSYGYEPARLALKRLGYLNLK